MVPDIQLRLLDVGFPTLCSFFLHFGLPTFNVTYCTSGFRRVDTAISETQIICWSSIRYFRCWKVVWERQ